MKPWTDVEVISVEDDEKTDAEDERIEDAGNETDEEIFSQEPQVDDEEFTVGQARNSTRAQKSLEKDDDEEEATIGEARDHRQQRQDQRQAGWNMPRPRSPPVRSEASWESENMIDLTGEVSTSNLNDGYALSFQDEYEELVAGVEGEGAGPGLWFPFEALAELLLRHPEHWWCRYPEAMEEMLLSLGDEAGGGGSTTCDDDNRRNTTGVDLVLQEASIQLCACRRCLRAYHAAKGRLRSRLSLDDSEERSVEIARYMAAILDQDRFRLQRSFRSAVDIAKVALGIAGTDRTHSCDGEGSAALGRSIESPPAGTRSGGGGGGGESSSPPTVKVGVEAKLAFWEVLSYWELLEDDEIEKAFVEALGQITDCDPKCFDGTTWERHWPGVLMLLVHRDARTRAWAQKMAKKAGRIDAENYCEILSPVIDRWVHILERGLLQSAAFVPGGDEKERLHWSGLHAIIQLLEPGAAPLLTSGFPTLVDLILQKFDDGPSNRAVPLYLQVCGCFAALLRLLGTGIWNFCSLLPYEVLQMVEQRVRVSGGGSEGGVRLPPNEAVHKKALEVLPFLVSSSFGVRSCAITPDRDREVFMPGDPGSDEPEDPSKASLADAALEFVSKEIVRYRNPTPSEGLQDGSSSSLGDRGSTTRKRTALNQALLGVLEACYGRPVSALEDSDENGNDIAVASKQRLSGPETWPWNADPGALVENKHGRGSSQLRRWAYSSRWPLMSVKAWGPRLADAAGDRDSYETVGGVVVEGAAAVVELVLRRHAGGAWSEALYALRVASSDGPKLQAKVGDVGHQAVGKGGSGDGGISFARVDGLLPLCEPLLERLCLELPVLDLPARVHSAVFEAHAWLALLPCGESALRAAEANGPTASAALARLRSGLMSQCQRLFVPYVLALTAAVKNRGAAISPVLRPDVAPSVLQAFFIPLESARACLEDLLACSVLAVEGDEKEEKQFAMIRSDFSRKGDIRPLLARLPRECARACFSAIPQALGAMAAAGPHLSVKSWGPLFQAAGALGPPALLPPSFSPPSVNFEGGFGLEARGGGEKDATEFDADRDGFDDDEEEEESWMALNAIWEVMFLQVIPEALPALRGEHATRLEEALTAMFDSLESLWPLLTGPISRRRRPELADAFLLSRSLWLQPLLSWVSEPWLPTRARESCARFIQRALLPLLDHTRPPTGETTSTGGLSARALKQGKGINAISPSKKVLRLVGNKLSAVEESADDWELAGYRSAASAVGEEEEEAGVLQRLRLASVAASPPDADYHPTRAARETSSTKASAVAKNPFFRTTDVAGTPLRGAMGGSSTVRSTTSPWTVSSKARVDKAAALSPEKNQINTVTTAPTSADIDEANAFNVLAGGAISPPASPSVKGMGTGATPVSLTVPESPPFTAKTASVDAAADKSSLTAAAAKAAQASRSAVAKATKAPRAKAVLDTVALSSKTMSSPAKGSVVNIWREMQRKRRVAKASPAKKMTPPATNTAPSVLAESIDKPQQNSNSQSVKPLQVATQRKQKPATSEAAGASATQVAFDVAALVMARRRREASAVDSSAATAAAVASAASAVRLDHSALAKSGTAELHRLVLSSWTVQELLAAASDPRGSWAGIRPGVERGRNDDDDGVLDELNVRRCNKGKARKPGAAGLNGMEGKIEEGEILTAAAKGKARGWKGKKGSKVGSERGARLSSSTSLWLCKVPTRFQSVVQYREIFRCLLMEEIFASLVSALGGNKGGGNGGTGAGGRGGRGGGHPAPVTLSVASFVEAGEGSFSQVTLTPSRGNSEGWSIDQRPRGSGPPAVSNGFFPDDVLMLTLVDKSQDDDYDGEEARTCLAIMDRVERGAGGNHKNSLKAKLLFRLGHEGSGDSIGAPHQDRNKEYRIPKKSSAGESAGGHGKGARSNESPMLRACRETGTRVRVTRLESLSTSTREFIALESTPNVVLLHHLLQATSEPRLEPLPLLFSNQNSNSNNPWAALGPPYPIDEASFVDACQRLSSVESALATATEESDSLRRHMSPRESPNDPSGGAGLAVRALMGVLERALQCLASFRVTPDLLASRGKDAAKCLKRLSKSSGLSSGVYDLAARLLRAWRNAVSGVKKGKTPKSSSSVGGKKDQSGKGEKRSGEVSELEAKGGTVERALAGATTGLSLTVPAKKVSSSPAVDEKCASPAPPSSPPRRPSLVPVELWDLLSREFNHSQVRAVWAATASAREHYEESQRKREQARKATVASSPGRERAEGGVVLLQGPPGTGKTRTVLGVVSAILARRKENVVVGSGGGDRGLGTTLAVGSRQKRPTVAERWAAVKAHQRLLVCAPSNGAVDELAQRLVHEEGGVWNRHGKAFTPRVVRVGNPSDGATDRVKAVALDFMVEKRVKNHPKSVEAEDADSTIKTANDRIDEVMKIMKSATGNRRYSFEAEVRQLRRKVLAAKQQRRNALRFLDAERGKIRKSLISNAQIICATLSGCGSTKLVEAVNSCGMGFDTVIVDEACQATELSTLIPLSLGCKRLILIGDPRQLPATVISREAAQMKLEVSLFERLEDAGHPVHMLTVQYRMHPEIRAFPSARFYDGRLVDAPCISGFASARNDDDQDTNSKSPPSTSTSLLPRQSSAPVLPPPPPPPPLPFLGPCFPPFIVVDVSHGREQRVRSSFENTQEASLVVALLSRLVVLGLRQQQQDRRDGSGISNSDRGGERVRVGVIAPYREQVQRITKEVGDRRRLKGGAEDGGINVDVSTVDGFQGREMDVVIFSCVRAPSAAGGGSGYGGGIGFLSDKRRMNVAITRAKHSLVILGHVDRLSTNATWKALVDHAAVSGRLMRNVVDRRRAVVGGGGSAEAFCANLEAILAPPEGKDLGGHVGGSSRGPPSRIGEEAHNRDRGRWRPQIQAGEERNGSSSISTSGHDPEERLRDASSGQKNQREAGSSNRESDVREGSIVSNPAVVRDQEHPAASVKKRSLSGVVSADHSEPPENRSQAPKAKKVKRGAAPVAASCGSSGDRTRETEERTSGAHEKRRKKCSRSVHPHAPARRAGGDVDSAGTVRPARSSAAGVNTSKDVGSGFLSNLLGSMQSNAARIASGETHDFREGLKGDEGDERVRAAAAPRLDGARVTELGRSRESKSAQPAKFLRPPTSSEILHSGGSDSSTGDVRRVGYSTGKSVGRVFGSGTGGSRREGRESGDGVRNAAGGHRDTGPRGNFPASDGRTPSRPFSVERGPGNMGSRDQSERTESSASGGSGTKDRRTVARGQGQTTDRTDLRATPRESVRPEMALASARRRVTGSSNGHSRFGSSSQGVPASRGAPRPPTETRARGSDGRAVCSRSSGGNGTGAARRSGDLGGMGVLDILKGIESTWGGSKKK